MNYHNRMMNIPCIDAKARGEEQQSQELACKIGHRDARHAAAEIANEADAKIRELRDALQNARDALAGLPLSLGYDITHLPAIDAVLTNTRCLINE